VSGELGANPTSGPRRFLWEPALFGVDPGAAWRPLTEGEDPAEVVVAYWQHLAVCALRDKYPVRFVEVLADLLGKENLVYLRRQLFGEYRVSAEELVRWALKLRDVSLLPSFDTVEDLYPPGSVSGRPPRPGAGKS
jgi:hypothetical protein